MINEIDPSTGEFLDFTLEEMCVEVLIDVAWGAIIALESNEHCRDSYC